MIQIELTRQELTGLLSVCATADLSKIRESDVVPAVAGMGKLFLIDRKIVIDDLQKEG